MHKHIILFFSALLFLFACKSSNDTKGLLRKDVLVHLLVEVHMIDGSLATQTGGDSLYKYGTGRYDQLLKQYHTDSAQFKKSVKYYTTQPDELIKMYADINKILQAKSDSFAKVLAAETKRTTLIAQQKAKAHEKAKQDSIKLKLKKDTLKHKNALPKK
jgi:hypothetical protein